MVVTIKINETTAYSFSGENEYFIIQHGEIIKNRKFEQISYSSLKFKNDIPTDSYKYEMELYFINSNKKIVITKNGTEINPNTGVSLTEGQVLQQLGRFQIDSSEARNEYRKLQDVSNRNIIKNFYFEITFTTYDRQEITQTLKLDVEKIK